MEQDKIITINTKIPIQDIVNKVLDGDPRTECEFNNLLIYNYIDILLEKLNIQLNQQRAGKKKKRKTKTIKTRTIKTRVKRLRKGKKTRKLRNQKGGMDPRIILFFMSMLIVFVKGVKNVTDTDVIKRIKQANEVSELFRNYYGTCTLNTLLFLKTIDIPTFADLSVDMMTNKPGFTTIQMEPYLNKELNINSRWYSFSGSEGDRDILDKDILVEKYIERIRNKLISLRSVYGFNREQSVLTAMNYPKKQKGASHSVVIWLTSTNEIIIIEPQKFLTNNIILYTSEMTLDRYLFNDKSIKRASIRRYISDNIDITNEYRDTDIFQSIHIEIDDVYGKERLSSTNERVIDAILKIKAVEEGLEDKEIIEEL
jgi:hypothetical protein